MLGEVLHLGYETNTHSDVKQQFMYTLDKDLHFLQKFQLMDYSLLVSIEQNSQNKLHRRFPHKGNKLQRFGSQLEEDRFVFNNIIKYQYTLFYFLIN